MRTNQRQARLEQNKNRKARIATTKAGREGGASLAKQGLASRSDCLWLVVAQRPANLKFNKAEASQQ
jgi:hypothetical protein